MNKRSLEAFSLLELSIVLLIVAAITGSTMTLLVRYVESNQEKITIERIAKIKRALIDFRIQEDRIPCPARFIDAIDSNKFGHEGGGTGTCEDVTSFFGGGGATNGVKGAVPTKALSIPDSYAFDGWGNRFTYVVDKRMTAANAFVNYDIRNTTPGMIAVRDGTGTNITTKAIFLILSHGANGHGAYTEQGTRIDADSTEADELNNCNCDSDAVATSEDRFFVQKTHSQTGGDSTKIFDDILEFMTRSQIRNPTIE